MGSFFVVQVQTGSEIESKEMLKVILDRAGNNDVKAIYAMETYTEVINNTTTISELTELDEYGISDYLHIKRIQSSITNLRTSCDRLKESMCEDSASLLESYQKQIRSLTKVLQNARKNTTKISSLLKGYILIETSVDYSFLPSELWHLIKSVPKVVSIPSKYNVPIEEIESFFENFDMTPQIEVEFDNLLSSVDDIRNSGSGLVHEENQAIVTEEKELAAKIDNLNSSLEVNFYEMLEEVLQEEEHLKLQDNNKLLDLLGSVRFFFHKKRERVTMPLKLFNLLCSDKKRHERTLLFKRDSFLNTFHNFILYSIRSKGVEIT